MLSFNLTRQLVWYTNRKKVLNQIKLYFQKGKLIYHIPHKACVYFIM